MTNKNQLSVVYLKQVNHKQMLFTIFKNDTDYKFNLLHASFVDEFGDFQAAEIMQEMKTRHFDNHQHLKHVHHHPGSKLYIFEAKTAPVSARLILSPVAYSDFAYAQRKFNFPITFLVRADNDDQAVQMLSKITITDLNEFALAPAGVYMKIK